MEAPLPFSSLVLFVGDRDRLSRLAVLWCYTTCLGPSGPRMCKPCKRLSHMRSVLSRQRRTESLVGAKNGCLRMSHVMVIRARGIPTDQPPITIRPCKGRSTSSNSFILPYLGRRANLLDSMSVLPNGQSEAAFRILNFGREMMEMCYHFSSGGCARN